MYVEPLAPYDARSKCSTPSIPLCPSLLPHFRLTLGLFLCFSALSTEKAQTMVLDTRDLIVSFKKQEPFVCPREGRTMHDPTLEKAVSAQGPEGPRATTPRGCHGGPRRSADRTAQPEGSVMHFRIYLLIRKHLLKFRRQPRAHENSPPEQTHITLHTERGLHAV